MDAKIPPSPDPYQEPGINLAAEEEVGETSVEQPNDAGTNEKPGRGFRKNIPLFEEKMGYENGRHDVDAVMEYLRVNEGDAGREAFRACCDCNSLAPGSYPSRVRC
ncbi:hypothetical protein WJU16_13945 [Chitinophaga pollutisoli]|uniref:Uncharacterized protein n=1 Tax=Chitinophaga pollutisoli TaxID=3133966 RepID=A0ABZ2YH61_9BACT